MRKKGEPKLSVPSSFSKQRQATLLFWAASLSLAVIVNFSVEITASANSRSADTDFAGSTESGTYKSGTQSTTLQTGTRSTSLQTGTESTTLQTGTQNTLLQTGTETTTLQTGTQSTTLQTGTQNTLLQTGTQSSLIKGGVEHAGGPVNILFIIDCSFSMKEKLGGQMQKLESAKLVLQNALARIPPDINVGLRVFGQGIGYGITFNPGIDCRQTALLVPLGQGNRRSIIEKVRNMKPFGMTPLEFALRQGAEDDFADAQGQKIIILISDGADTCGGDPCRFIRQLPMFGIKLKVDVVGLDLKRDHTARNQLNCVAEQSGGKYYDADTAAQMIESVSQSVNKAISGRILPKSSLPAKNLETPNPQ
jgi:Ca-activated chloride channel family protein